MATSLNHSTAILQIPEVIFKKLTGTLFLFESKLVWKPESKSEPEFSVKYIQIKIQKISSANTKKVKLQLVLENDNSPTFYFNSLEALEQRNSLKDKLQEMISGAKTIQIDMNAKIQKLKEDTTLLKLYNELVASNNPVLKAEEFWSIHSDSLRFEPPQETGIPTSLLTDLLASPDGDQNKYILTQESIHHIFRMYPAVRKKHIELVPDKASEEVFWRNVLQSLQFHGIDSVNTPSNSNFTDATKHDESYRLKDDIKRIKLSNATLLGEDADYLPLSGEQKVQELAKLTKPWILRSNYQNRMIIGNSLSEIDTSTTAENTPRYNELNLTHKHIQTHKTESIRTFSLPSLDNWAPNLLDPISPGAALQMLTDLSPGGSIVQSSLPLPSISSQPMKAELVNLYRSCSELLRHFWSCFPVTNPLIENKLHRLYGSLKKFPITHIKPFVDKFVGPADQVTSQLRLSVSLAVKKYDTWARRKKGTPNRTHFKKN